MVLTQSHTDSLAEGEYERLAAQWEEHVRREIEVSRACLMTLRLWLLLRRVELGVV